MKYSFKPYSKNIIFLDTEFSHMDPYKGEILSIGLIKLNGEELYLELEYKGGFDPWVTEHIVPTLMAEKVNRKTAVLKIREFVGKDKPYVVSFVNQFDIVYMHKLFNSENIKALPFYWLPIDFASILFGMGMDPYDMKKEKFLKKIGVDSTKFKHTHNALEDARLLREVYLKITDDK